MPRKIGQDFFFIPANFVPCPPRLFFETERRNGGVPLSPHSDDKPSFDPVFLSGKKKGVSTLLLHQFLGSLSSSVPILVLSFSLDPPQRPANANYTLPILGIRRVGCGTCFYPPRVFSRTGLDVLFSLATRVRHCSTLFLAERCVHLSLFVCQHLDFSVFS